MGAWVKELPWFAEAEHVNENADDETREDAVSHNCGWHAVERMR